MRTLQVVFIAVLTLLVWIGVGMIGTLTLALARGGF
jgi:hypothetical protein